MGKTGYAGFGAGLAEAVAAGKVGRKAAAIRLQHERDQRATGNKTWSGRSQQFLSGYRKARALRHRPAGTPRGGEFY